MKKKKVLILTLCGNKNYGNRLQNYALSCIIEKFNFNVETLWIESKKELSIVNKIKYNIKNFIRFLLKGYNLKKLEKEKLDNFNKFNSNIKLNKDYDNVINGEIKYDYYVVGSDQVWNYSFSDVGDIYFLPFAEKDKTISYAASFGVSEIDENYKENYITGLNHIKNISVREKMGADIVYNLIKKKVDVVLDPTLLLEKNDWNKVLSKPKKLPNKKYILTVFLGTISNDLKDKIIKLADENDCEIINLFDVKQQNSYVAGPSEFIYYISNASLILTDSFHACCFSIIYEKQFYVFNREGHKQNMISRIDSLLDKFNISERKISYINDIKYNLGIDYNNVFGILEKERKKSLEFLSNSLK